MPKRYLEILKIGEGAGLDEINAAYDRLKKQYSEERFAEGERGAAAARALSELEEAYSEAIDDIRTGETEAKFGGELNRIDALLREGKVQEAQESLDAMPYHDAEWHYLQSVVFYKKGWFGECRKQLQIARTMDPANAKYISASERMEHFNGQTSMPPPPQNPGGQGYRQQSPCNSAADCCTALCCCYMCTPCC